jgi:hypothetical protein
VRNDRRQSDVEATMVYGGYARSSIHPNLPGRDACGDVACPPLGVPGHQPPGRQERGSGRDAPGAGGQGGLGNKQILAGYYDGPVNAVTGWLDDAKQVPGVDGVMYTTWQQRYDDLERFINVAKEKHQ